MTWVHRCLSELCCLFPSRWYSVSPVSFDCATAVRLYTVLQTRSPGVARIADRTGCQRLSRSSKVDDFYLIWKGVWDFLLVINSYLVSISHHFRDTATYSLKLSIANCGQTAADGDMVTIDSLKEVASTLSNGTTGDPLRLTVQPQYILTDDGRADQRRQPYQLDRFVSTVG